MKRILLPLALTISIGLLPHANAAIEFVYAIKEKVFDQQGNTQPVTPTEWSFGAGASGDEQLTAVSVTHPGEEDPIVIVGDEGSYDLDPDSFQSQAALDAAFPNGSVSFNVTDGGDSADLGPFSIAGDAYPVIPHITNALELQASDYSQDFLITWNAFTGADADDQIIFQLYDDTNNEELIFEFLANSATSFTIPGNTLSDDRFYEVEVIFVNETDGLVSPETIIGYLSTTSYLLSTHTSDTELSFYKWRRSQQTASDQVQISDYRMLSTVTGVTKTVSYAEITSPTNTYALNAIGNNTHFLITPWGTKAELDNAYPAGEYRFWVTEDNISTNYGFFILPGDAYPTPPQFQNFTELLNFDATQEQSISWTTAPSGVSFVQVRVLDQGNNTVWNQALVSDATNVALPANTLTQDQDYRLIVRFWGPAVTNDKPPTALGYLSSTYFDFQTSAGGGDPGIEFAYTIKEKSFQQTDNTAPTDPFEWSFGAGVQGGSDITGGSLDHPGGNLVFTGTPGEYDTDDLEYANQAELDAAFPSGSYTLNITVDGSGQALGPFDITGDAYPTAPHITNLEELQASDHTQNFTLNWNAFNGAVSSDRILIIANNRSNDDDLVFEFLDSTATSYEIPGGTLTPENRYEFDILFVKDTGGLETPDTIIGYITSTTFDISTITSDTDLAFYKVRSNIQTASDQLQEEGYRPLVLAIGNANSVTYAEINSPAVSNPLIQFAPNSFFLIPPLGTKNDLDASYPPGDYLFYINENGSFINYDDYILPPDAYPGNPILQNFDVLQSFDASQEQPIQWNTPTAGVTLVSLQIRDESNQRIWSADLEPDAESAMLPPDTLNQLTDYTLIVRFWARQAGSDLPDASLGYLAETLISFQTYPDQLDFATWLQLFFTEGELLNPDIVGADSDPDGDKLNNRFEFLAKLNPIDNASALNYDFTSEPGEKVIISPIYDEVFWEIQSSTDLFNWVTVETESYTVVGNQIQIGLESFLPNTFFQVVLSEVQP